MARVLTPDLCVIGGGSAGLTVAAAARAFGASVVLIERDRMGGDCLNTGCVPSKALIAAAKYAHAGKKAAQFGVSYDDAVVDYAKVRAHVQGVINGIAPHDSVERFEALGATVIKAHARFISKKALMAGDTRVEARRFIIATGSRAAVPPISGLANAPFLTNETIFDLKDKPAHLLVIGGGPIGMELAQAYARLGSRVTVVEADKPLSKDDPELTTIALKRIAADGVDIRADTQIVRVEKRDGGIALVVNWEGTEETILGSHLLVAAGRRANLEELGLVEARVKVENRAIKVNKGLRTSNRRIYAIGDVNGGLQFTHVAGYQGSLVVRSALFGLPAPMKRDIIPWATYTDPEIANVGLSEADARKRHGDNFKILRWSYSENDRARTDGETDGLIKLITDKKGLILGCGIAGAGAGEMISIFAYAIGNKQKVGSLLNYVAPYPTLTEMAKRVAVTYYQDKLSNPWIGRWMALIRLLQR